MQVHFKYTIRRVWVNAYSHITLPWSKYRTFHHPPEALLYAPLQSNLSLEPQSLETADLLAVTIVLPFLDFYIDAIKLVCSLLYLASFT